MKPSSFSQCAVVVFLLGASLLAAPAYAQGDKLTDEQVSEGIEKIKEFLYAAQDESGAWFGSYHQSEAAADTQRKNQWGPTAIALLSLIVSGESPQHPKIAKGLDLLASKKMQGVYALSMRAHVWSYLPDSVYGRNLERDADQMLRSAHERSQYDYVVAGPGESFRRRPFPKQQKGYDTSATQYGILALWQASKRGVRVPDDFWAEALRGFLEIQSQSDGGWGYSANDRPHSAPSLTLAGLTCLYVVQQELFRDQSRPNTQVQASINRGLEFLDKRFTIRDEEVYSGNSYMWYGYERVGLASGRKYFGGRDWYQEIAKEILAKNARYDRMIHAAAFELMFLSRGRVPVWINKLEIPGTAWNNRPNDVYFLNRFISEYREHEVNWQIVGIDSDPKEWISAPLMWISSDASISWTDEQVAKLKTYLDLGGTIIANPEERSSAFRTSIEELAAKLYPELAFEDVATDHPMVNLLEGNPRTTKRPEFQVLSNGARVLMVMPKADWGMTFQEDTKPDPDRKVAWRDIVNIYGVVTNRGELTPRLSSPWVERQDVEATGTIKVFIPQWEDAAGKVHEDDVYRVMKNYMYNQTGRTLDVQERPLSELASAKPALLHMMGVNAVEITDAEREAIQAYVTSGGTVLIENLGGTGDFATSVRDQIGSLFTGIEDKISTRSDIITGRNLPDGSKSNRRVVYRRLVLERSNSDGRLLLRGWPNKDNDKRVQAILSYEDISLGMLGVKQYGINGYSIDSARDLMVNILLDAEKGQ